MFFVNDVQNRWQRLSGRRLSDAQEMNAPAGQTTCLIRIPFKDAFLEIEGFRDGAPIWSPAIEDSAEFLIDARDVDLVEQLEFECRRLDGAASRVFPTRRWCVRLPAPECLHRMIARRALGNPEHGEYCFAVFINGNSADLRRENLRWVRPNRYFGA